MTTKPHKGTITKWVKIPHPTHRTLFTIAGEHGGEDVLTSTVVKHDHLTGEIETLNSRYTLVPANHILAEEGILKTASIEGVIKYERNPNSKCVCCKGESETHVFARWIELEKFESEYPEHFGKSVSIWADSQVLSGGFEGKRVRVTIEVLE